MVNLSNISPRAVRVDVTVGGVQQRCCLTVCLSLSLSHCLTAVGSTRTNRMGVEVETISPGDGKTLSSNKFEFQIPERSKRSRGFECWFYTL